MGAAELAQVARAPPRERRSTLSQTFRSYGLSGSSARAEIDPTARSRDWRSRWLLRASGDRPAQG